MKISFSRLRVATLLIFAISALFSLVAMPAFAQVNVLTQRNDIGRTGQNTNETILTPANVSSGNFGKLFTVALDGQVYAQPLYLAQLAIPGAGTHNVVFTATMHDSVYAHDADSGALLWHITLLDAAHGASPGATTDPVSDTGCTELEATEFGITSTPVIDPVAKVIYVVGKTFENGYPVQRLHALSVTNGAEMANSPVTLTASVNGTGSGSNNGVLTFDPKWENQRAGLLLVNGIVYLGFASYCDYGVWHGWILAYNGTTMKQTSVFTPTPNSIGSGIWMSGTGLAADIPSGTPYGRMFVPTGNGTYDATKPYGTNNMDYGVDVLRLDLTNGVMTVSDAFTPFDQANLNANDQDMASGGLMVLPDQPLAGHPHQLLAAGKTGNIYVVDRDNLGGYSTTSNNIIEYISPNQIGGSFGSPAYWNSTVFYWGDTDHLTQFDFTGGLMNDYHSENSSELLTYPGSSPVVSSNGTSNGIVWAVDGSASPTAGDTILLAHDATNVSTTLYSSATNSSRDDPGRAVKMQVPTVTNGKVYLATYGGISAYGLLTPNFAITAVPSAVSLPQGGSATTTITITQLAGFSGKVTLTDSGLPSGMTLSFATGSTSGTLTGTFAAASNTVAGSYPIVITGTSGTISHSVTVTATVTSVAAPSFTLTASPSSISLVQGSSATSSISVVPANGFNSAVTLSASGLPSGVSASFGTASGGVSVMTVSATTSAPAESFNVTVTGTSGSLKASTTVAVSLTAKTGTLTPVNLSPYFTSYAAFTNGTNVTNGGFDGGGDAFSSNLLGSSVTCNGVTFPLGPANAPNAVSEYKVVLPAGNYSGINLLASASHGTWASTVVVTYTDGTSTTFNQSFSNWWQPANPVTQPGESVAISTSYFNKGTSSVTEPGLTFDLFAYYFPLNPAKTVAYVTLPPISHIKVFSIVLGTSNVGQTAAVNLAGVDNLKAIANNGTPVSGIGNDGWAYSANLLGNSITWAGTNFQLGSPNGLSAVTNKSIPLPPGNFSVLKFLATGIYGPQTNQLFTVDYTDGTASTLTQSLSDWGLWEQFPGESVAAVTAYRVTPAGGTQPGPWNLYGYSIPLDSTKTVQSLVLPANGLVVVLAVDLINDGS